MAKPPRNGEDSGEATAPLERPLCGIVMPISAIDGCSDAHWAEVLDIVRTSAENAGFEANLVSTSDDVGIIQKRIIQNLYDNPIVVCDVSGRNPNVMFELGLRLAFDKPTIIIKDDKTSYAFDTSPIEHLEYPRDLRFTRIVEFKELLADKIKATHKKAAADKNYTTFLSHFGEFKIATVDVREVSGQEVIIDEIKALKSMMRDITIKSAIGQAWGSRRGQAGQDHTLFLRGFDTSRIRDLCETLEKHGEIKKVIAKAMGDETILEISLDKNIHQSEIHDLVKAIVRSVDPEAELLGLL